MRYIDSVREFFLSPRWMMNLLLAGVCSLIPVVGPMVVMGWLAGGFWGRDSQDPATFPDFDFARFSSYLERGLWPVLVSLVVSLAFTPVIWVGCTLPIMAVGMVADRPGSGAALVMVLTMAALMAVMFALTLLMMLALKPLMLRALLTQNFAQAFDLGWAVQFLKLTWLECVLAAAFVWAASLVLSFAGLLVLCVGIYFTSGPIYFSLLHLDRQIYLLFVGRGGAPVPVSPKLRDAPPPAPAA